MCSDHRAVAKPLCVFTMYHNATPEKIKRPKKSGSIKLRKRMTKQESIFVQDLSAVRIQAFAHAIAARRRFRQLLESKHAAIKIQASCCVASRIFGQGLSLITALFYFGGLLSSLTLILDSPWNARGVNGRDTSSGVTSIARQSNRRCVPQCSRLQVLFVGHLV